MTLFWVLSGLLVGIAWWFVLRPLLARGSGSYWSRRSANLAIYRDQLREREVDLRAGTITSENFDKARRELEARVLDDVGDEAERNVTRAPSRGMAAAVALIIPAGALAIYFAVGTPGALVPMPLAGGGAPHATDAKRLPWCR